MECANELISQSLTNTGYVAAVGIPEHRRDHAVVMMRFAHDILYAMGT